MHLNNSTLITEAKAINFNVVEEKAKKIRIYLN